MIYNNIGLYAKRECECPKTNILVSRFFHVYEPDILRVASHVDGPLHPKQEIKGYRTFSIKINYQDIAMLAELECRFYYPLERIPVCNGARFDFYTSDAVPDK